MAQMPKEIAEKDIQLLTIKPRNDEEQQDFIEGIKTGLKKASAKVSGIASYLQPNTSGQMAKDIDENRKYLNKKPTDRTAVEFYLVFDSAAGLYLQARWKGGGNLLFSKPGVRCPDDLEKLRSFLTDLHDYDKELVNDYELDQWNKNNPSKPLQDALKAREVALPFLQTKHCHELKGPALAMFIAWAKTNDQYAYKIMEALKKSKQKLPPAAASRMDAALKNFNTETLEKFDNAIKKAGGVPPR